jgi:hypothetical protein
MEIKITLDAPKGWARRALLYVAAPLTVVSVTAAIASASPHMNPIDTTWVAAPNQISAAKLKGNLDDLQQQSTDVQAQNASLQTQVTKLSAPAFCGETALSYDGALTGAAQNGYPGAKALCLAKCGGTTAHLCHADEMLKIAESGFIGPQHSGWIAGGAWANDSGASILANDCEGFTSKSAQVSAATWSWWPTAPAGLPGRNQCDAANKLPLFCCD